MVELNHRK